MTDHAAHELTHAISSLASEAHLLHVVIAKNVDNNAILHRLAQMESRIMEAIVSFSTRVNSAFDAISASVDEVVAAQEALTASQVGIAADVTGLKDIIAKLQTTPGVLTPEDQALLDSADARATALVTRTAAAATAATALSAALKALDESTENPPAPTA